MTLNSPREHSRVFERDLTGGRLQAANTAQAFVTNLGDDSILDGSATLC